MLEKGYTINVLDHGYVRLIDWLGSDERVCEAARISYHSPSKGVEQDQKLINYLWKNRHTSPFEQINLTFNIKLPLFVQGQMVRHRTQRLNQVSARYTEILDEFYIPKTWRKQDTKDKQGSIEKDDSNPFMYCMGGNGDPIYATDAVIDHCALSYNLYKQLICKGIAKEMARMILPQNLYTEIYSNWDLNNLTHFFTLRLDEHAQWEIRQYAKAMYDITKEIYPMVLKAYDRYKIKVIDMEENK